MIANFLIQVNTQNLTDARVVYTGDYKPEIKQVFKAVIKKGDIVLDIGANIGFHSLYFSVLTGERGKVISFEPVPVNYEALCSNIILNRATNIIPQNIVLSNKNEDIEIYMDQNNCNPGAFDLFEKAGGNTKVLCRREMIWWQN